MGKTKHIMILLTVCLLGVCFSPEAESADKKDGNAIKNSGYQTIPEAEFRKAFDRYLRDRLGKEKSDVIVSRFKVTGNEPVPPGKMSLKLYKKEKKRLEGYVRLIAIISVNGVVKNKVKLSGWIDVFESVVCASRNLKKRDIIKADDVYLVRRNISRLPPGILIDMDKAIGLMVKNSTKAETSIKDWMLEKPPVVEKGDMVTILVESDGLRVTVPGLVLEQGYLGGLVQVQNTMSNKRIYARVTNPSTVTVDF